MKFPARLLAGIAVATALSGAVAGEGTVVSAIGTDMYTYVEVEQKDKTLLWIAVPAMTAKPGDQIRFEDGMMMTNFYSKQLKRTFPAVMFVQTASISAEK